mgnify:CR=1 FL=1
MTNLSIFTTMTNPETRNDPWREAISCYEFFANEVVVVGDDWPEEFTWDHIGKTFQEGYEKCTSDWVMRMDIDYFLHEKYVQRLRNALVRYKDYPAISLPQYQIFTPDRYQIKTKLAIEKINYGEKIKIKEKINLYLDFLQVDKEKLDISISTSEIRNPIRSSSRAAYIANLIAAAASGVRAAATERAQI